MIWSGPRPQRKFCKEEIPQWREGCSQYIYYDSKLLAMVDLIPSWLVWAEIECSLHVVLPKQAMNQFKPVQQSRHQTLRAYCHNIYICTVGLLQLASWLFSKTWLCSEKLSNLSKLWNVPGIGIPTYLDPCFAWSWTP